MANIDMKEVNAVFVAALPKYQASVTAKQDKKFGEMKAMGIAGISPPMAIDLPPGVTFCGSWPQVRAVLNKGLWWGAFVLPASSIAIAKAWLTTADFFVAKICGPQA